ncbi:hypothetical protein KEU06_08815 [Pseudaminobacter sp. 19-2017]|uniref:Uncharacterized protein n=1 Tax=Pseudaminobacter soli (ex Zhang et al. 2022) TaxID=2831468 RepID=A0A942DW73_9HYPH|nr:hypothetical protein [Pseudaminobacter soli]MBS3648729.1 hypothetical protein [Pseudaminobacter soli]
MQTMEPNDKEYLDFMVERSAISNSSVITNIRKNAESEIAAKAEQITSEMLTNAYEAGYRACYEDMKGDAQ